jgi:hypothetical protein
MRTLLIGVVAAAVAGCAPSTRDTPLADLDLADGVTLAALQGALPPNDRALLGTYALLHWPKSRFYCGQPIGGRGPEPSTVGEAIDQTRAYEAALERTRAKERVVQNANIAREEETALITRIEQLVYERDMLYGRMGPTAATTPRGAEIKESLDTLHSELDLLRNRAVD